VENVGERFYVDSNILVYHLVEDRRYGLQSKELLERSSSQHLPAYTSVYTMAEIYATLRAFGFPLHRIIASLEMVTEYGISMLPLSFEVMSKVPSLMRQETLGFGDAVHVLTMRAHGLSTIITEDRHFENVPGIHRRGLDKQDE
jgi:predicted nucleic acid-binding protein